MKIFYVGFLEPIVFELNWQFLHKGSMGRSNSDVGMFGRLKGGAIHERCRVIV